MLRASHHPGPSRAVDVNRQARRLGGAARVVLVPVALIGAVLSFRSLYEAASPTFGPLLGTGFPLLVDLLILGASLQYVAGAKVGRPMVGWKLTAYAGVAGTLVLNVLAASRLGEVPWHVTAPAVWAVLVELTAAQVLGEYEAVHHGRVSRIPLPLWFTAPVESARTRLLMARTGNRDAQDARVVVGVHAAAREALRLALPDRHGRRVRRIINRQLRAGSLPAEAILGPLGWMSVDAELLKSRPEVILKAILRGVLAPTPKVAAAVELSDLKDVTPPDTSVLDARRQPEERTVTVKRPGRLNQPDDREQPEEHGGFDQKASGDSEQNQSANRVSDLLGASSTTKVQTKRLRLSDAVQIVARQPHITGPELRTELARMTWKVSDRTATRILADAKSEVATSRLRRSLAAVSG